MKNVCLILGLVIMSLSGCANNTSPKTISTPQSLQSLSITTNTGTNTNTVSNPSTEENNSQPNDSNQETETSNSTEKTFATQQDFVDYMYEKVKALEDTVSLLDSNLTQVYSVQRLKQLNFQSDIIY